MASGLLNTAISGLFSFQQGLTTTGHNIANVNTEGFSRQRVELSTNNSQLFGSGFIGNGVQVSNITRIYDQFLINQVRTTTSAFSELDSFHRLASSVDDFIAEPSISVIPALETFFGAVQELANDPASIPARQVLLSEAETLADRFVIMDKQFAGLTDQVNQNLAGIVADINDFADALAKINQQIVLATNASGGKPPNDLLDQRDQLLTRLAGKVDVTTLQQGDELNIFIGNGQPLVLGNSASRLSLQASPLDPGHLDIVFANPSGSQVVITRQVTGGEMGGTLRFRDEVLEPARRQLGLVAVGVTEEFNRLHRAGFDLLGGTGNDFFKPLEIDVTTASGATLTAVFNVNTQDLKASDYRLTVDAAGTTFTLTRLSDNQVVGSNGTGAFSVDGLDISVSGVIGGGESFLIRPAFGLAGQMGVNITDPSVVAAAASPAVGDNEIALQLAGLQDKLTLLGGTATFQETFGQLVAEVGTRTRSAEINRTAQQGLLNQAIEAREAVSGVNLDEEAANLLKYQQAYQAAAQLIVVTNTVFDSLLGAVRR